MKNNNTLLIGGAVLVGAYLLLSKSTSTTPGTTSNNPLSNLLPGSSASVPTTYGVNSGVKGGNGSFYTVSNYPQLLAANPNLGNPNYQMTSAQISQYLANYQDLATGLPQGIGLKMPDGTIPHNINEAAQAHWKNYGVAEKRIYLPLQPPSSASYIPPPANANSSGGGGSWVSTALTIAGTVASLLGPNDPTLSDADINALVTGGAIIKKILPFYLEVDPELVASIENKLDSLLTQYQN